jgi:uncharacterized protein YndB with AHSA1/START domain
MAATTSNQTDAEREIVVSRTIQGPRRLVFTAFTDVGHLARWWGPQGFTTTTRSFEFRAGGVWEFIMHGPDGVDYPNRIEWREIAPPERIAYLHSERADDPHAFESTVTLVERGGATEVTLRAVFRTKEQRNEAVARYGAVEGGRQALGRLAAHIATLVAGGGRPCAGS